MGWNTWFIVSVNIEKFIIITATKRKMKSMKNKNYGKKQNPKQFWN